MNYRMIGFAIGRILLVEAALLLLPMAVQTYQRSYEGEDSNGKERLF